MKTKLEKFLESQDIEIEYAIAAIAGCVALPILYYSGKALGYLIFLLTGQNI